MREITCKDCLFGDKCHKKKICKHFSPFDEYALDVETLEFLLEDRRKFYEEWHEYISEYGDK